jgi:hypothetical protein
MPRGVPRFALPILISLILAAPAPAVPTQNPADRLVQAPIEDSTYDRATRCSKKKRPGVDRFVAWLQDNTRGVFWGSYRCEMWGKKEASLHAEGRAVDWHLDARNKADAREAKRLIDLLLAPDALGNEQALARRMGVQEIIWDCGYWGAGMGEFNDYSPCFNKRGKPLKKVNATVGHMDHIHFGLTKAGAMGRTSFWTLAKLP